MHISFQLSVKRERERERQRQRGRERETERERERERERVRQMVREGGERVSCSGVGPVSRGRVDV